MARLSLKTKTVTNDLVVNIGTSVNDKTGDPLRTAFGKLKDSINQAEANFIELYSAVGADVAIPTQTNNANKYLTTNGTTLRWDNLSNSIYAGGPGGLRWEFEELTDDEGATYYGRINFPDGSFQSTAFVGLASTAQDLYKDGEIFIGIGDGSTTTNQWSFGTDGNLTLPAGGDIVDSTGTSVLGGGTTLPASTSGYLKNDGTGTLTWDTITVPTTLGDLGITAGSNGQFLQTDGAGSYTWADINITGAVVVAVPLHSYGVAGDTAGMIAFDQGYFYWCFQNYVDNSTDCWKRVNAFAGSW